MPGIPTQFEILRLTMDRLQNSGDPELMNIASVMQQHSAFAHLGAIGAALGDFLPSDPLEDVTSFEEAMEKDPNPLAAIWKAIFGIVGGEKGMFAVLTRIRDILDRLDAIAAAEDCDKLEDIRDGKVPDLKLEDIEKVSTEFANLVAKLNPLSGDPTIPEIAKCITERLKPKVSTANPSDPIPSPETWLARDFLHWRRSGEFVRKLIETGQQTNDEPHQQLLAYGYGYLVSYAGNVCSNPFINSAVGGPPRTQWWRQRFVKNYTDAWVFGFYEQDPRPTMNGDDPTPPYSSWPSLCNANLHQRIQIGSPDPANLMELIRTNQALPAVLPPGFTKLWFEVFKDAYPGPVPTAITEAGLNAAYLMTWLVLWFQTSGAVLGCNPVIPTQPPGGCGEAPSELDPFVPGPGGGPSPPPELDTDLEDETAKICGIILAILGGLLLLGGGLIGGAAAIAGAVALLDCSSVVEWQKLRCQLFWFRTYLVKGLQGLHKVLALTGLSYPPAASLALDKEVLELLGKHEFESGRNLVKSRPSKEEFPSRPWDGSFDTFNQRPTGANPGFEDPRTVPCFSEVYPSFYVDGTHVPPNPLSSGDVKTQDPLTTAPDGGQFRRGFVSGAGYLPVQFGNAVENAIDLFMYLGQELPNWNLDADRGLAYLTWRFTQNYDPSAVQIQPDP